MQTVGARWLGSRALAGPSPQPARSNRVVPPWLFFPFRCLYAESCTDHGFPSSGSDLTLCMHDSLKDVKAAARPSVLLVFPPPPPFFSSFFFFLLFALASGHNFPDRPALKPVVPETPGHRVHCTRGSTAKFMCGSAVQPTSCNVLGGSRVAQVAGKERRRLSRDLLRATSTLETGRTNLVSRYLTFMNTLRQTSGFRNLDRRESIRSCVKSTRKMFSLSNCRRPGAQVASVHAGMPCYYTCLLPSRPDARSGWKLHAGLPQNGEV